MEFTYYICDVFTTQQFGGNPLAVIPDAEGLTTEQMQKIAREFNFSESTFVFPATQNQDCKVRIFTPSREVPFAGHPNVGTAYVLTEIGRLEGKSSFVFEEKAGLVAIEKVTSETQGTLYKLDAPEAFSTADTIPVDIVAEALSLSEADIDIEAHLPTVASSGLPFLLVELANIEALDKAKINLVGFEKIAAMGIMPDIHMYVRCDGEFYIRARMFAPFDGVNEDPATGSANCALAGLLATHHCPASGHFEWRVLQGEKMGRPSDILTFAEKENGKVVKTGVAGSAVMFSQGTLFLN